MIDKEQSNLKKKKIKKILLVAIIALVVSIILISGSMAYYKRVVDGNKKYVITASSVTLVLDETSNDITIANTLPQTDEDGMTNSAYTFSIENMGSTTYQYTIYLEDNEIEDGATRVSDEFIKYYLTNDSLTTQKAPALLSSLSTDENGRILETGTIAGSTKYNYTLRFWVDYDATQTDAAGKAFSVRLNIIAKQEEDSSCPVLAETEPNVPQLTSGMIAVTYNETDKTWVKADTTNNDWYDYKNQIWANAVTVTEDTRDTYMAAEANTPISMDDINTMWVWIPRYSYTIKQPYGRTEQKCSELGEITIDSPSNCRKVGYPAELRAEALNICKEWYSEVTTEEECLQANEEDGYHYDNFEHFIDIEGIEKGDLEDTRTVVETYPDNIVSGTTEQPGAIDIRFIKTTEKDTGTGKCENCAENWVTPEGFNFGEENIPGFWMGKFETSTLESCTAEYYSINTGCDLITLTPQIKPNVTSWRGARVSTFFEASRLMQSSNDALNYNADTYGFDIEGTSSMDTHMLKNTEWGIVAMLSQSKYGKYGNPNYSGVNKEVTINNCSDYITGIGGDDVSDYSSSTTCTTNTYETDKGQSASTTGTIYGVYDMSGGAYEYVMGNYNNFSGYDASNNSGFCGTNGPIDGTCREWPNAKYFDLYTSDNASEAYKFGEGTYETSGWYSDYMDFASSDYPWFVRGGYHLYDTRAGVFYFGNNYAGASLSDASRFVIKP